MWGAVFGWILAESFVFTSAAIYAILEHTDSTCLYRQVEKTRFYTGSRKKFVIKRQLLADQNGQAFGI